MSIQKIGVLGTGQMGTGIIQVFAQSGYDVIAVDAMQDMLDKAVKQSIRDSRAALKKERRLRMRKTISWAGSPPVAKWRT